MSDFLNKLKQHTSRIAEPKGKIIFIDPTIKALNCPNHFTTFSGIQRPEKHLITISPKMDEVECDCGTIYKKTNK